MILLSECDKMTGIKDIESTVRELIRTDESIVSAYDYKMLCRDYDTTVANIKELIAAKKDLTEKLENQMNEFFKLKQNFLFRKLKINSFKLIPSVISFEYIFFIPKSVKRTSRQYYCYISMMDRLTREYDSISKINDAYSILDITATLNLDELLNNWEE